MTDECCGSGCNNCVLDQRQSILPSNKSTNKTNVFTRTYCSFLVTNIVKRNSNVNEFTFIYDNVENHNLSTMKLDIPPGHHLMLRAPSIKTISNKEKYDKNSDGNYISRPYTPIHVDSDALTFKILVKFEANGFMSKYLQNIKVGDATEWKGVYGEFVWTANAAKHIICISHGVAIAPLYSIITAIVNNENDNTIIHLLACFKNIKNILLRDELTQLRCYWNFHVTFYLSREFCSCDPDKFSEICFCLKDKLKYNEIAYPNRLNHLELMKHLTGKNSMFFLICGLKEFVNKLKSDLLNLNIKEEQICIF